MSEVRGRFITLAGSLMSLYPVKREEADALLFAQTGKHYKELEPEGWFDTKWIKLFLDKYVEASLTGTGALVTFGRKIYPTIKATLPKHLKTPLDFLKFENETFLSSHKGPDVKPRKYIKSTEGNVIIQATVPSWNHSKLYEGVYVGILEMCGVKNGKVVLTKIQEKGDGITEYHITWNKS